MRTLVLLTLLFSLSAAKLLAQEGSSAPVQVSMALLSLASGHDGQVVLGTGEQTTDPMQLSTRYFSKAVKTKMGEGRRVKLYFPAVKGEGGLGKPLTSFVVPPGSSRVYVALSPGKEDSAPYEALVIPSSRMPIGSLMLMNSTGKPMVLKIEGSKPKAIKPHGFLLLKAQKPAVSQRVEILTPSKKDEKKWKTVFSSKWHLAPEKREFCIIYPGSIKGKVRVRSLFENNVPIPKP